MTLQGCGTALVTPFHPDGSLDEPALTALVRTQIENGISLLIPCGTTGEASTLTEQETDRVIQLTIEAAEAAQSKANRVPVFAGCTHNSTAQAVLNAKRLAKIPNLTGLLTANPYYNRPNQEGQYQHFRAIAEAVDLPILLYNIPGRTATNLLPETVLRLAELPNIIGIKESSGVMSQITELLTHAPTTFSILAGDDALALPVIALGGTRPGLRSLQRDPRTHVPNDRRRAGRNSRSMARSPHLKRPLLRPNASPLHRTQPRPHQSHHGPPRPLPRNPPPPHGPRNRTPPAPN